MKLLHMIGRRKADEAKTKTVIKARREDTLRDTNDTTVSTIPCWHESEQRVLYIPRVEANQLSVDKGIYRSRNIDVVIGPLRPRDQVDKPESPSREARQKTIILPLSSDHLIALLQFNALRAVWTNRQLLVRLKILPPCTFRSLK